MDYNAPRGSDLGDGVGWIWSTVHTPKKFLTIPCMFICHLPQEKGKVTIQGEERGGVNCPKGEGQITPTPLVP